MIKNKGFFSNLEKRSGQIVYDSMPCHSDKQVEAESVYSVIAYVFYSVIIKQRDNLTDSALQQVGFTEQHFVFNITLNLNT